MSVPPTFFVDHKRGEVNELKALLNNPAFFKQPDKRREIIKKVIAYMTLGIDVSKVFSEMVMAASTKDLVQKKMVYHYLCNYAQQKADLAILAINTLQKDCRDEDPMVRGLALRSLCALRIANISEYVMLPLRSGLNDPSAYVRKTAVIGIAKLFQFVPDIIKKTDLVDILYNMLKDKDTQVITNVIHALNEILQSEGGMVVNSSIVLYLLNRIKEYNEWGQCVVLELVAKYKPADENQMFDIMNLLEDRLKHSNSAVVLGTTKVFLNFTQSLPKVHEEVYKRLKAPLLTLMGSGSHELSFTVLSHVDLLVNRAPHIYEDSYKHFFVRFNDASCVKLQKLSIISSLVNNKNFSDILNELAEYVTDIDPDISRFAIRSMGKVAIKLDAAADESLEHLVSFLDLDVGHVTSETIIALKDLLRKYPHRYEEVLPSLTKVLKNVEEEEGKVACIWMIGEFGDTIDDAPYILEPLVENFSEEVSSAVRIELLTASMKLFFKRPPELKAMLGKLLKKAIDDTSKVDVRDRALLFYRLLSFDVHEAARVVNCPKQVVDVFAESEDKELKEKIFKEFNTLSVTYGLPQEKFTKAPKFDEEEEKRKEAEELARAERESSSASLTAGQEIDPSAATSNTNPSSSSSSTAPTQPNGPVKQIDLLGDFMSQLDVSSTPAPAPVSVPTLTLLPGQTVDKQTYQSSWGRLPVAATVEVVLKVQPITAPIIESSLQANQIVTFASGTVNGVIKFYLFARDTSSNLYLIETVVDIASGRLVATIKADGASAASNVSLLQDTFKNAVQPLC